MADDTARSAFEIEFNRSFCSSGNREEDRQDKETAWGWWLAAWTARAPAQDERGDTWKPIETAPRDGTRIWGYFPHAPRGASSFAMAWGSNVYEKTQNWTLDDGESATLTHDAPTYWMPLPAAPDADRDREGAR